MDETAAIKRDAKIWSQQIRIDVICEMAKFVQLKMPKKGPVNLRIPEDDWWAEWRDSWKIELLRNIQDSNIK